MIDLAEAGRRLGDTRVGPTPPPHQIRARLERRMQRRRMIIGGSAASALAAIISVALIVVVTSYKQRSVETTTGPASVPTPTATSLPAGGVAGSTPYDYQRLRLWLPSGWSTSTSSCHAGSQSVYFPGTDPSTASCLAGDTGAIVVVRPLDGAPPAPTTERMVHGIPVEVTTGANGLTAWDVPSLHVEVDFHTSAAEKVAETLEPSPLQDVLTANFPTSVPSGWKTVTFSGFQAKVPPTWPTHSVVTTTIGNATENSGYPPGICFPPLFHTPAVYLGGGEIPACPSWIQKSEPPIDDGLWLQPSAFSTPLSAQLQGGDASNPERLISVGSAQALVMPGRGDSLQVEVVSGGHEIEAFIGLGLFPGVAEAILSSIAPVNG
jgi:hypothetical protein